MQHIFISYTVKREIFVDENFRDLKGKVCEIIFAIFISRF